MGVCPMAHRSVRLGAGLGWESDQGYTRCVGMDTRSLSARAAAAKAAAAACSATLQVLSSQMSEQAVKVAHSTAWKQVLVHLPPPNAPLAARGGFAVVSSAQHRNDGVNGSRAMCHVFELCICIDVWLRSGGMAAALPLCSGGADIAIIQSR